MERNKLRFVFVPLETSIPILRAPGSAERVATVSGCIFSFYSSHISKWVYSPGLGWAQLSRLAQLSAPGKCIIPYNDSDFSNDPLQLKLSSNFSFFEEVAPTSVASYLTRLTWDNCRIATAEDMLCWVNCHGELTQRFCPNTALCLGFGASSRVFLAVAFVDETDNSAEQHGFYPLFTLSAPVRHLHFEEASPLPPLAFNFVNLYSKHLVAVKTMRVSAHSPSKRQATINELCVLRAVERKRIECEENAELVLARRGARNVARFWAATTIGQRAPSDVSNVALLMDYADGGNLHSFIASYGPLLPREAAALIKAIGQALAFLHGCTCGNKRFPDRCPHCCIVHRDLKPQNILLHSTDRGYGILLADFGVSREIRNVRGSMCGTMSYMAPEVANRAEWTKSLRGVSVGDSEYYSEKADMFSLGVLLQFLLSGGEKIALKKQWKVSTQSFKRSVEEECYEYCVSHFHYVAFCGCCVDCCGQGAGTVHPLPCLCASDAVTLINSLIHWDPQQRPSAVEVLKSPFLTRHCPNEDGKYFDFVKEVLQKQDTLTNASSLLERVVQQAPKSWENMGKSWGTTSFSHKANSSSFSTTCETKIGAALG